MDPIRDRDVETADADAMRAIADAAWTRQRSHVGARSEFYRRKFSDEGVDLDSIAGVADLPRLPFTTKDELRVAQEEHPPFGSHLAVEPEAVKRVFQTSGTSGEPLVIALTADDIDTWTRIGVRSYSTTGLRSHNSVATTFGAGPFVVGQTHDVIRAIGARSVPVGPGDTPRLVNALRSGLADTLLLTPSFAIHLADRLVADQIDPQTLGVRHLLTGGEPGGGLPSMRSAMEGLWGARVTEVMGLGDISPSLFGECPEGHGMHFCGQGMVWPELVDEQGDPLPFEDGAEGELVYTALERQAMPLIRFRSGDRVRIVDTACRCGRTSFTMRVIGRVDDMFIVRGVNVYPSAIAAVVGEFRPALTGRCRIVLPNGTVTIDPPVIVEAELPSEGRDDVSAVVARLEAELRSRLTFTATVVPVPSSQFGDAGYKTRPVVRRSDPVD